MPYYASNNSYSTQQYQPQHRQSYARKHRKAKGILKTVFFWFIALLSLMIISITLFVGYCAYQVNQNPISFNEINSRETIILDRYGNVVQKMGNETSEYFPSNLRNAVISIEDKRFYQHEGVDLIRTTKAIIDTLTNGSFGAGGSTITQQLIKNVSGDSDVTIARKVREWIYSVRLESVVSKDEILNSYLNKIYFGHGNFGAAKASRNFFGKDVKDLRLSEAAFLAALIKSPETYLQDLERANERKNYILDLMAEQGLISASDRDASKAVFVKPGSYGTNQKIYSWYTDAVILKLASYLEERGYSESEAISKVRNGGYTIHSCLDPNVQEGINRQYLNMPNNIGRIQSAMIILNKDGLVRGLVGGTGRKAESLCFNRATQARRQPGSAIKPLAVYSPALQEGVITTLSSYEDKRLTYNGWTPKNYDGNYVGRMSIRRAITVSNNTIAVQILNDLGISKSIMYLNKMGFKTQNADKSLPLAVGAVSVGFTPLEMASGYQTLINGGEWCEPLFYTKVVDASGNTIIDTLSTQSKKRVFSEETSSIMLDLMQSVITDSNGTGRYLVSKKELAAKTGTTDSSKDKWLCVCTPSYSLVSWFGFDQPASISSVSSKYIQGITNEVLKTLIGDDHFSIPATVQRIKICNQSGKVANDFCTDCKTEVITILQKYNLGSCDKCTGTTSDQPEEDISNVEEETTDLYLDLFDNGNENPIDEPVSNEENRPEEAETDYMEPEPYGEETIQYYDPFLVSEEETTEYIE